MKKKLSTVLILSLVLPGLLPGGGRDSDGQMESMEQMEESQVIRVQEDAAEEESNGKEARDENVIRMDPIEEITELETGLSAVRYEGDYGFDCAAFFQIAARISKSKRRWDRNGK